MKCEECIKESPTIEWEENYGNCPECEPRMKVELVLAENHFDDNNDGYRYGIYELTEDGEEIKNDYVEWFKTKEERQKTIEENNMEVLYEENEQVIYDE